MILTNLYEIHEEPFKLIQVNVKTFERLKEHNRYFSPDSNGNSFDKIIITLMDFYEENKNKYL